MKKKLKSLSFSIGKVSYKFIIPTALALLIILLSFIFYLINDQMQSKTAELHQSLQRTTKLLSLTSEEPLWNFNSKGLKKNVQSFFADKAIVKISIKDSDGNEVVKKSREIKGGQEISKKQNITKDGEKLGQVKVVYTNYYLKENIKNMRNKLLGITALVCILITGIIAVISKLITKPIIKARDFAEKIAQGNLNIDELDIDSEDEIGSLVEALNDMKSHLQEIVVDILDSVESLSSYSQQLSASAEEGNASIEVTVENLEEMKTSIEEISTSSHEVSTYAAEANAEVQAGNKNLDKTIESIKEIDNVATDTVEIINDLDDNSQEIGKIIELITNIAEQTNLLALNAAIEAARAGEAGQGFAVVADEIRELAEETADATNEIGSLIKDTQEKSQKSLEAVEKVKSKANDGVDIAKETGEVFFKIEGSIEDTSAYTEETSASAQELNAHSDHVMDASQEMKDMSQEIADSSQELSSKAEELRNSVEKFDV